MESFTSRDVQIVQDALREQQKPVSKSLAAEEGRGGLPGKAGTARPETPVGGGQGGAGINSPLTEQGGTREYYTDEDILLSADGFSAIGIKRIKSVHFKDAKNVPLVINYADE